MTLHHLGAGIQQRPRAASPWPIYAGMKATLPECLSRVARARLQMGTRVYWYWRVWKSQDCCNDTATCMCGLRV
eukprot:8428709-Lingulodinium_polyedra.AAC.1